MKQLWLSTVLACCAVSKKMSRQEENKSSGLMTDSTFPFDLHEVANLFCFGVLNPEKVSSCRSIIDYEHEIICVHGLAPRKFPADHFDKCVNKLHDPIIPTDVPQVFESQPELAQKSKNGHIRIWMAAVVKDQAVDLFTWVGHYLSLGAEHIIVLDNDSRDDPKRILQPYISKGLVTYRSFPGEAEQNDAYTEAAKMATAAGADWLGALDVDEWLFLQRQHSSINDLVMEVPTWCNSLHLNLASISAEDLFNAHEVVKPGDSAEKLRKTKWIPNKNSKSFIRLPSQRDQHVPKYVSPFVSDATPQCNADSEHMSGPFVDPPRTDSAYILHRQKGSLEGFVRKGIRGRADCVHCQNNEPTEALRNGGILKAIQTWLQELPPASGTLPHSNFDLYLEREKRSSYFW